MSDNGLTEAELMRCSKRVLMASVQAQAAVIKLLWRTEAELQVKIAKLRELCAGTDYIDVDFVAELWKE